MGKKQTKNKRKSNGNSWSSSRRDDNREKNTSSSVAESAKSSESVAKNVESLETVVESKSSAEQVTSVEDQANIEKVFSTLSVTASPQKTEDLEPAVPISESVVVVESESTSEVVEKPAEAVQEDVSQKSSQEDVTVESEAETEPEQRGSTTFKFEKQDSYINAQQIVHHVRYSNEFSGLLSLIDPETRHGGGIGPAETFDAEGVKALVEKIETKHFVNCWPFGEGKKFEFSEEENKALMKDLCQEILETIRFCFTLSCAERGYELQSKRSIGPISKAWISKIDPLVELKTVIAIVLEIQAALTEIQLEYEETKLWADAKNYAEVVIPALETFDSEVLAANGIMDKMSTLHGRKELGFEVKEEEVDQMLEAISVDNDFGPFVAIVHHFPEVFTTAKQLKLIFPLLPKMSKLTDIRVKQSGVQAITQIFCTLSFEQSMEVFEELKNAEKLPMKAYILDPELFDPIPRNESKAANYFKIFYWSFKRRENQELSEKEITAALLCFYLVCPAFDVNNYIYKVIGARADKADKNLQNDQERLLKILHSLPFQLRERLEIGEEFSVMSGEPSEESMYNQVNHAAKIGTARNEISEFANKLEHFLEARGDTQPLISVERVLRMMMDGVENGKNQKASVAGLNLMLRPNFRKHKLSSLFFEDLLMLALGKYSIPEVKQKKGPEAKKYEFMEHVFQIVQIYKNECSLELNEKLLKEKWSNLEQQFWFSILLLSYKFPILKPFRPSIKYPWVSADVWDEKEDVKSGNEASKYASLAKVSTAWPDCTDMELIKDLVADPDIVPLDVNRCELYKEMRDYVSQSTNFDERTQRVLVRKYEEKIKFLQVQTSVKKEKAPEESEEPEKPENPEDKENLKENVKKPRTDGPNPEFYTTFYSEDAWKILPPQVPVEVKRLRELYKLKVVDGQIVPEESEAL